MKVQKDLQAGRMGAPDRFQDVVIIAVLRPGRIHPDSNAYEIAALFLEEGKRIDGFPVKPVECAAILHLVDVGHVGAEIGVAARRRRHWTGLGGGRDRRNQKWKRAQFHRARILTREPASPSLATEMSTGPRPARTIA